MKQLWITGTRGAPWEADKQVWARLEKAYGKPFSPSLRTGIERALQIYFDWVGAPSIEDFAAKLKSARKSAHELEALVNSFGEAGVLIAPHWNDYFPRQIEPWADDAPRGDDDAVLLDWILSQKPQYRGRRDHRDFYEVVSTVRAALDDLQREVIARKPTSICERHTWKQLIVHLYRVFSANAYRATSTNGPDRPLSPFVCFVKEVQSLFPASAWRPASDVALSKKVSEVFAFAKQRPKRGKKGARRRTKKLPQTGRKRA